MSSIGWIALVAIIGLICFAAQEITKIIISDKNNTKK